jgi:hypothetical protein
MGTGKDMKKKQGLPEGSLNSPARHLKSLQK